jgi:hypothetical protein
MHRRLFASLAGGLLGLAVAMQINAKLELGLAPAVALIGCGIAGFGVGYVASMLFDVFGGRVDGDRADSRE